MKQQLKDFALDDDLPQPENDAKQRKCLSCQGTFGSQWPGERICKRCKHGSSWRSGMSHKPANSR